MSKGAWRVIVLGVVAIVLAPFAVAGIALRIGYLGDPDRLGLGDDRRQRFGVALYVDFAATDSDWRAYHRDWAASTRPLPLPARSLQRLVKQANGSVRGS